MVNARRKGEEPRWPPERVQKFLEVYNINKNVKEASLAVGCSPAAGFSILRRFKDGAISGPTKILPSEVIKKKLKLMDTEYFLHRVADLMSA